MVTITTKTTMANMTAILLNTKELWSWAAFVGGRVITWLGREDELAMVRMLGILFVKTAFVSFCMGGDEWRTRIFIFVVSGDKTLSISL